MNSIPLVLLAVLGFVLGSGTMALLWMLALHRQTRAMGFPPRPVEPFPPFQLAFAPRPASWLAIRSPDRKAVQAALGLDHFAPCSWAGGMTGGHGFFIGPPVNGWIIVTGSGLPNPDSDADECFRFLTELSRKLGHVQFFQAERVLHHHAWVRVENGVVKRAYAWAGETVWNQGAKTADEDGIEHEMLRLRRTSQRRLMGRGGMDGGQRCQSPVAGRALEPGSGAH